MTTQKDVAEIYNALYTAEQKFRNGDAYPIHKVLDFTTDSSAHSDTKDIYHWVSNTFDIPQQGHLLDAGCGVGFGSLYLAQKTSASIRGISLSENEIARATNNAKSLQLSDRTRFTVGSYDDLPSNTFDLIIAIESVKHSLNLNKSLASLTTALTPTGKLIIVDDFLTKDINNKYSNGLKQDWALDKVYSLQDFTSKLSEHELEIHSLDEYVIKKNTFTTSIMANLLDIAAKVAYRSKGLKIFRGGLFLDVLYARGAMSYLALSITKSIKTH